MVEQKQFTHLSLQISKSVLLFDKIVLLISKIGKYIWFNDSAIANSQTFCKVTVILRHDLTYCRQTLCMRKPFIEIRHLHLWLIVKTSLCYIIFDSRTNSFAAIVCAIFPNCIHLIDRKQVAEHSLQPVKNLDA